MAYEIREISPTQFCVITPAGNVIDTGDTLRPRIFTSRDAAQAFSEWSAAASGSAMTKSERRNLRILLGTRIGLRADQLCGFFN